MARQVTTGFSLSEEAKAIVDRMSAARGVSKSKVVNDLLLREGSRRSSVPEVVVDGVLYTPKRGKR